MISQISGDHNPKMIISELSLVLSNKEERHTRSIFKHNNRAMHAKYWKVYWLTTSTTDCEKTYFVLIRISGHPSYS